MNRVNTGLNDPVVVRRLRNGQLTVINRETDTVIISPTKSETFAELQEIADSYNSRIKIATEEANDILIISKGGPIREK